MVLSSSSKMILVPVKNNERKRERGKGAMKKDRFHQVVGKVGLNMKNHVLFYKPYKSIFL